MDSPANPVPRVFPVSVDLVDRKEVRVNRVLQETTDQQGIREGLGRMALRVQLDNLAPQDLPEKRVTKDQEGSSACWAVKVLGGNEASKGQKDQLGYKEKRVNKGKLDQMVPTV